MTWRRWWAGWGVLGAACSSGGPAPKDASAPEVPRAAAPAEGSAPSDPVAGAQEGPQILSAYYGLDRLPPRVARICGAVGVGQDGMPVTFSVRLRADGLEPADFAVTTATGAVVAPVCATLAPADEALENRTVLLAGPFGTPDAAPTAVEVVGEVEDVTGASLRGLRTTTIVPLAAGPSLVFAERFDPSTQGLAGECPEGTQQVVQLTWQGGVTGPQSAPLGEAQRQAILVELADGTSVHPAALADDDPDNFVHACLNVATPARSVTVSPGHFHDPGDGGNPATRVQVVDGAR